MIATIDLDSIIRDDTLQIRNRICEDTVEEYTQSVRAGEDLPPIDIFDVEDRLMLADGWHRDAAYRRAGASSIEARVHVGTMREARLFAAAANGRNGLRLSSAEKRRAVRVFLVDEEWRDKSNRDIARAARVSHTFVASMRPQAKAAGNVATPEGARTGNVATSDGDGPRAPVTGGLEREPPTPKKPPDQGTDAPPCEDGPEDDDLDGPRAKRRALAVATDLISCLLEAEAGDSIMLQAEDLRGAVKAMLEGRPQKPKATAKPASVTLAENAPSDIAEFGGEYRDAVTAQAGRLADAARRYSNALARPGVYVTGTSLRTDHKRFAHMVEVMEPTQRVDLWNVVEAMEALGDTAKAFRGRD